MILVKRVPAEVSHSGHRFVFAAFLLKKEVPRGLLGTLTVDGVPLDVLLLQDENYSFFEVRMEKPCDYRGLVVGDACYEEYVFAGGEKEVAIYNKILDALNSPHFHVPNLLFHPGLKEALGSVFSDLCESYEQVKRHYKSSLEFAVKEKERMDGYVELIATFKGLANELDVPLKELPENESD